MTNRLNILIVEDNLADSDLLVRELNRAGLEFDSHRVDTESDYLDRLNSGVNVILSDCELPEFSGLRALELLKGRPSLDIPFIIVSGTIGEETAVRAMQQGAADYLFKDRIGRLGSSVRKALRDVTEREEHKRMEARFIEAQKMEVVGHLAAGIAHDFNNILAVIMGYNELIADELKPANALFKYTEEIYLAATRAAGLTQQLLIFSRKQTVQAAILDLNDVVQGMDKMLRRLIDENIEMKVEYGKNMGRIHADSGHICQVLMNLVVNARDAMPNGGKITIQTSAITLDQAYAHEHPGVSPGEYIMLLVGDVGCGMSEEVKSRMFEAFFTTKGVGKGTGLGLVTCQTIVRQSGGHIDVSSELGTGTVFRIYFPRVALAPHASQPVSDVQHGAEDRGTEVLLLVEDEPSVRHLAEGVLRNRGYHVLTAPNGQDALRVAREHRGAPIALVLTDVIMPRMGGKVMAEWLQTMNPDLKILFMSGYTDDALAHHGVSNGTVDFLPKPYSSASLTRKVRELLDAPRR